MSSDSGARSSSKLYGNFKKFDIVKDVSDHYYEAQVPASSGMEPSKNWVKKIQEEWRILKKHLPDMIFVRVYESRMDLLRAAIMGAEGTPYHDGLFFFDVCFSINYPDVPPAIYYHSRGLHMNPNLYDNGKVCLSLLNNAHGDGNEKWIPGSSTMLQVLVSIQGLILNAKPYFNHPTYEHLRGSLSGETLSLQYNEQTLVRSLKTMVYVMKTPPKHFKGLVIEHFRDRAHAIFMTCKAYCEGVRVGCVFGEGEGEGEREEGHLRLCKSDVEECMKMLAREFERIGVKGREESKKVGGEKVSLTRKVRAFFYMCIRT